MEVLEQLVTKNINRIHQYENKDLGPTEFNIGGGVTVVRTDFELPSARNHKMQCSHFEPLESQR